MNKYKRNFEKPYVLSYLSVLPYKAVLYRECVNLPKRTGHKSTWYQNFASNDTKGVISKSANKTLVKAIHYLLYRSKLKRIYSADNETYFYFRINFITLTLPAPQAHSDTIIKERILKPFISRISRHYKMINYIWRAETQLNGNIHFHLTSDVYIPQDKLRYHWNQCCNNLGYIDQFEQVHGHRDPNSTDVHAVKHVKNLTNYLSKYMGKNRNFVKVGEIRELKGERFEILYKSKEYAKEEPDKKRGRVVASIVQPVPRRVEGRQWFASKSLQSISATIFEEGSEDFDFAMAQLEKPKNEIREVDTEYCRLYFGEVGKAVSLSRSYG